MIPKKVPKMEDNLHTITKSYGVYGFFASSREEITLAGKVIYGMLDFIQSQGIDVHFRRKPTIVEDYNFEHGKPQYQITMRAALLPSDTEIGKQYDHSNGPLQINLTRDTKEEVA